MKATAYSPVMRVSVLAIMVFQACALFARSALDVSLAERGVSPEVANDLSYLVVPPILAVLLYPYLRRHWKSLLGLFRLESLTCRLFLLAFLLGVLLRLTYWSLLTVSMWAGVIGEADPNVVAGPILGFGCPPLPVLSLSLLTMSVLVPLVEETINRGLLLHSLISRGVVVSVVLSAFLFALAHRPDTYIAAFAAGLLLAVQTLNSRTLWASFVTHGTYNLAATIQWDCFQIIWNPPVADPALAAATRIAAPAAVASAILCCWLVSKQAIGASVPRLPDPA